ncbi:MAG: hypothetical protein ACKO3W_04575 [bacterium]
MSLNMMNSRMDRVAVFACAVSLVALCHIATLAEGSNSFARFTYARATVKWGACPGGGSNNILEDLELSSTGLASMSASVATGSSQCAWSPPSPPPSPRPPAGFTYVQCGEAVATGSGNLEAFSASVFTCLASHPNFTSAEIRYTALRRHKGIATTNGTLGVLEYRPRGEYTLSWFYSEFAGIFLPMDITENGIVDGHDLARLLHEWGSTSSTTLADTNCDGIVDLTDLARLLAAWKTDGATP